MHVPLTCSSLVFNAEGKEAVSIAWRKAYHNAPGFKGVQ